MPLKVEPLEEPYLNMTPMVDVILNLLIFFMIGSRFVEDERQVDIQLPSVSHAQPLTAPPKEIVINVYADGHMVVDQKPVPAEDLEEMLSAAQSRYADQAVLIRGDGKGSYQSIMDVLSICQKAKIHKYSLATQPKGK
jgi:biopolymer transport protein ExbD